LPDRAAVGECQFSAGAGLHVSQNEIIATHKVIS
jgi:hypothetical protein